ncbi:MAG: hypothetical protein NXH78_01905 [Hyphomonadaceae bacterium]|nr:hypothetical protein [Hyphomonadaceae bacterium]
MFSISTQISALLKIAFLCLAVFWIGNGTASAGCGGTNEKACAAWKKGPQCSGSLTKYKGVCRNWGKKNKKAWPAKRIGFRCDKGLAPDGRGNCKTCGHRDGQPACEKARRGPQCYNYMEAVSGVCRGRGGEGQAQYSSGPFNCKPGFNVGDDNKCTACGGQDQIYCEAARPGKQCDDGLDKYDGTCGNWGGENEEAWPAKRIGFRCDEANLAPDADDICVPCGANGQVSCEKMRVGQSCSEAYSQENDEGICRAVGGEGQPIMKGIGFDCRPGFNWRKNSAGEKYCTACGGHNQIGCEATRSDQKVCNSGFEYNIKNKRCYRRVGSFEDPFFVTNKSSNKVYATVHWYTRNSDLWIMDEFEIPAGATHEFKISGERKCSVDAQIKGSTADPSNVVAVIFADPATDSCSRQHFQVLFWEEKMNRATWAVENALVALAIEGMTMWAGGRATEQLGTGVLPVPGLEESRSSVSSWLFNVYQKLRDPDGDLSEYGVTAWAYNIPQREAWVTYWDKDTRPEFGFTSSGVPDYADLEHPCEGREYVWATSVNDDGDVIDGQRIYYEGMCDGYQSSSASTSSTGSRSTRAVRASSSAATTDGLANSLWMFEVQGNKFYLKVVEVQSNAIVVQRANSADRTTYNLSRSGEYMASTGQRIVVTTPSAGQWISADGSQTYSLSRVN